MYQHPNPVKHWSRNLARETDGQIGSPFMEAHWNHSGHSEQLPLMSRHQIPNIWINIWINIWKPQHAWERDGDLLVWLEIWIGLGPKPLISQFLVNRTVIHTHHEFLWICACLPALHCQYSDILLITPCYRKIEFPLKSVGLTYYREELHCRSRHPRPPPISPLEASHKSGCARWHLSEY